MGLGPHWSRLQADGAHREGSHGGGRGAVDFLERLTDQGARGKGHGYHGENTQRPLRRRTALHTVSCARACAPVPRSPLALARPPPPAPGHMSWRKRRGGAGGSRGLARRPREVGTRRFLLLLSTPGTPSLIGGKDTDLGGGRGGPTLALPPTTELGTAGGTRAGHGDTREHTAVLAANGSVAFGETSQRLRRGSGRASAARPPLYRGSWTTAHPRPAASRGHS